MLTDRPSVEIISNTLLNSVGVKVLKTMSGIKFQYKKEILSDLEQLGFSIDILKVKGGEMPLPLLHKHVDEQAALEAYWSAQSEKARYRLKLSEDLLVFFEEKIYYKCFNKLVANGIPKPTANEVKARMASMYGKKLNERRKKVMKLEHQYRMLFNCCYTSIATKGRMLQSLRNIIQGGMIRMPSVETESIGGDLDDVKLRAQIK